MADEEKVPIISTSGTSGLASVLQLTDDTPNEIFTIRHSTSGTETVLIVEDLEPEKDQDKETKDEENSS